MKIRVVLAVLFAVIGLVVVGCGGYGNGGGSKPGGGTTTTSGGGGGY